MLMRFDPFRGLDELTDQLRDGRRLRSMPLDAYRIGDTFHVDLDLPGVKPESIEVTVEKNVLSVKAERQWKNEDAETVVCERPTGTFTRELFLGENLDTEKVAAAYENGVLRLTIPVAEKAKARRIEVRSTEKKEAIATASAA
ncbi:MAG: Hsp20/alpha crystallin family protein [Actinomycetota bacterium]|nr:Hsp20/alpha crystallin family protein [Actinomycetota bacterium]